MADPGIVRNRAKIEAAIALARIYPDLRPAAASPAISGGFSTAADPDTRAP